MGGLTKIFNIATTIFNFVVLIPILGIGGWLGYGISPIFGIAAPIGAFIGAGAALVWAYIKGSRVRYNVLRGSKLKWFWIAHYIAQRAISEDDPGFLFGRLRLPSKLATRHILVSGTTGSGKTLIIRLLMQSVLPSIGTGQGHRALIFDGKKDLLGILYGMEELEAEIYNFDPFDARGYSWNIAQDISTPASAQEITAILFPKLNSESQPFFSDSVRLIATGIIKVFIQTSPGTWRFADLIRAMATPERMQSVLEVSPEGRDVLASIFSTGDTLSSIVATIKTKIQSYEVVAALWESAQRSYSLSQWVNEETIIIIRTHHEAADAVSAINRALFIRATQMILSKGGKKEGQTWVILDELATAGKLEVEKEGGKFGITDLLDKGREFGVCAVLGFQNISGLQEVYGVYGSQKLTALCSTLALLKFTDEANATWASGYFGKQEVRVTTLSETGSWSEGQWNSSTTTNYEDMDRVVVMPAQFQSIAEVNEANGLQGYFLTPLTGSFKDIIPGRWLFGEGTLSPNLEDLNFEARNPALQWLKAWSENDKKRLLTEVSSPSGISNSHPISTSRRQTLTNSVKQPSEADKNESQPVQGGTRRQEVINALKRSQTASSGNGTHQESRESVQSDGERKIPASQLPTRKEVWDFSKTPKPSIETWDFSKRP